MRRLITASTVLLSLGLIGCSAPAEPDEAAYLEGVSALGGSVAEGRTSEELLEHGTAICDFARESNGTVSEAYDWMGQQLGLSASNGEAEYWSAVSAAAGSFLCPDLTS